MDGIHDLGGKVGYGQVDRKESGAVFQERWEAAVFTMTNAIARAGAFQNIDQFRHAIERITQRLICAMDTMVDGWGRLKTFWSRPV